MKLNGSVINDNYFIKLVLIQSDEIAIEVEALINTSYTGELIITPEIAELVLIKSLQTETIENEVVRGGFVWAQFDNISVKLEAHIYGTECEIGTAFLKRFNCILFIDIENNKESVVTIEMRNLYPFSKS